MSKADKRARKRENRLQGQAARAAEAKRRKQRSGLIRGGIIAVVVVAVLAIIIATGHKSKKPAAGTATSCDFSKPARGSTKTYTKAPTMTIDKSKTYTATMTTSCGTMKIALDAKNAPIATNNFVFLARHRFFDGLTWHRIIPNFVDQGGDPKGDGSGGPGYSVKGEVPKSGRYELGDLAAAKTGTEPNGTMGSQFFVIVGPQGVALPPQYADFGHVTSGLAVADKIESYGSSGGTPTKTVYIDKVTISES